MLEIIVTGGVGEGGTELAAFDAALNDAGIMGLNLVKMSSVIPSGSVVHARKYSVRPEDIGNVAYVVLSECYASKEGETAYAGLGWALFEDDSGVFVEHHSHSAQEIRLLIQASLKDCVAHRKAQSKERKGYVAMRKCYGLPVCAVVCAVYKTVDLR